MRRRCSRVRGHANSDQSTTSGAGCGSVDPMSSPPPDLHRRARGAAGEPCAGSSTPRCGPHVDEWEAAGLLPRRALPPLRRARLPRPPLSRARWGGSDGDLAAGPRLRRGAGPVRRGRDPDGDLGADRTWPRPRSREFGTDDQRERWLATRDRRRRRSARSRSPSPTPAPTSPRSAPAPCATATCGASTAGRCSSPTAPARTSSRSSRRPIPTPATTASRCSSSTRRCPASRCRAGSRSSGMHSSDTAEIALDDVARARRRPDRPRAGPGLRAADVAAAVRAARGRGRVRRPRGADARRDDRVRARAHDVRAADRAAPGDRAQARRRGDRARSGARVALLDRVARDARRVSRSPRSR